jgi:hypothetical protein
MLVDSCGLVGVERWTKIYWNRCFDMCTDMVVLVSAESVHPLYTSPSKHIDTYYIICGHVYCYTVILFVVTQ